MAGSLGARCATSKPLKRSALCDVVRSVAMMRTVPAAGSERSKASRRPSTVIEGCVSLAVVLVPAGRATRAPVEALSTAMSKSVRGAGAATWTAAKMSARAAAGASSAAAAPASASQVLRLIGRH